MQKQAATLSLSASVLELRFAVDLSCFMNFEANTSFTSYLLGTGTLQGLMRDQEKARAQKLNSPVSEVGTTNLGTLQIITS